MSEDDENSRKFKCPECGGEMSFQGYRPLFPTCNECGKSFHIDDCEEAAEDSEQE